MSDDVFEVSAEGTSVSAGGAYFAPGTAADHEYGVLYQGDYQHEADGTAIAARLHARALAATGLPVLLKPFTGVVATESGVYEPLHRAGVPESVEREVGELTRTSISKLFPAIRHFVVHKTEDIFRRLMRGAVGHLDDPELILKASGAVYSNTVLYSVWERDRVDDRMARELSRMGDNWVPCEQNAEMLRSCGVQNVTVMPHPFAPDSPLLHLVKRRPHTTKRFYNIGRWEPRKNQVGLLFAFFNAFKPGDDATLTLKFHGQWPGYPSLEQTLVDVLEECPAWTREQIDQHLIVIDKQLRADQMWKLHFDHNIYVAPSAGEAWCLPAFEAKQAGNQVIHTPYGGTADFCEPERDWALQYTSEEVPRTYGWPQGSQWAHVQESDIAQALAGIELLPFFRSSSFEERFSLESVGARMRARLVEVFQDSPNGGYLR